VWNDDRQKEVQQLKDSCARYFVVCWFSTIFFLMLLFFNLITFFGINITSGWRRDTRTILRSIWILNQIYGWRQDRLIDPIEIRCMVSLTLRPMTYGQSMFQLLTQTLEFETILDQWVQTWMTHLITDYAWLGDEIVELCRLVMNEITDGWYMCFFLLASQSQQWPSFSSSSGSSILH